MHCLCYEMLWFVYAFTLLTTTNKYITSKINKSTQKLTYIKWNISYEACTYICEYWLDPWSLIQLNFSFSLSVLFYSWFLPSRKMMDSGQLDFYQHSTLCTNTCRSTKFDLLINNARFPPDGTGLTTPTSSQGENTVRSWLHRISFRKSDVKRSGCVWIWVILIFLYQARPHFVMSHFLLNG